MAELKHDSFCIKIREGEPANHGMSNVTVYILKIIYHINQNPYQTNCPLVF